MGDGFDAENLDASAQLLIERVPQPLAFETADLYRARQIYVHDLMKGVHARIGSTGADDDGLVFETQRARQRGAQQPHHGIAVGLIGKSVKCLTVVGQVEAPALGGA